MSDQNGAEEEDDDGGRMTLIEHLTELRTRLIICLIAIAVCATVMFFLYNRVLSFLSGPYEHVTRGDRACGGTRNTGCDLIATGPLDPFLVRLKVAGYGGLAVAIPIIFWEIWRFVTPGLRKNERRYAVSFAVSAVVLFLLGAVVGWFTLIPALDFLLHVGGAIQPLLAADKYLTLVALIFVAFGVAFEFPLLIVFLLLVRAVNTRQLRHARRWVIVGITVFAAVITPSQDPFSLLFMASPMYLFYEIAIIIGRILKR
jgi:sec-independent protein translocase protein TatC